MNTVLAKMPVSYTHLRAHETVLDIVCRLLLEKKTNHISPAKYRHATLSVYQYTSTNVVSNYRLLITNQ